MLAAVAALVATLPLDLPVRSVRIHAPQPGRVAPYLAIAPGQPLDPDAVRRTVALVYASGAYEDVSVEVERGPEGLDVVVRTRPAPLLTRARVAGDRLLSPRRLLKIARLREGEPLWPALLERAGRDAALALSQNGYLEARVSVEAERHAAGADAVFRIHAGPRVRVGSVRISAAGASSEARLGDLARPRPGQAYVRARAERAVEAMRRRLLAAGRWEARVELQESYDPARARIDLVFAVAEGPFSVVEVRGASVPRGLRRELSQLLREGGLAADVLEAGVDRLERHFVGRGHRDVRVRHLRERRVFGQAVVYEVEPGSAAQVASVRVQGIEDPGVALRTRPGEPLEESALEEDRRGIQRALEDAGHTDPVVELDVGEGGGPQAVVFRVRPGARTLVREVHTDSPSLPPDAGPRELRLRAGEPYRVRDLAADRAALVSVWRNAGYLQAEVRAEVAFSADRSEVSVRLQVDAGPQTLVDQVVVAGLRRTREQVVRRELRLKPGGPLGQADLLESQRRLAALGIFERVNLTELDPERRSRRDLVVSVVEAAPTVLAYGVGYAERDLLRGSFEVTRRNLLGTDRTLTAFARASFRGSRFLLSFREPWLFGRRQELFATAFYEEEDRTTFDFDRSGALLQTARSLTPSLSLIGRYSFQQTTVSRVEVPIEEVDRQFRTYTLAGPSASLVDDTRDDPLDPRRGRLVAADVQLSLRELGGDSFVKGFVQAAVYHRLTADVVLAAGARLGLGRTLGAGEPLSLPFPERFLLGGPYGMRGFEVDTVGPLAPASDGRLFPTGGNALAFGGTELRVDVSRFLSLAAFSEAGNVYGLVSEIDLGVLRYAAGLGLRYKSALGPLRLDWGYKLNRRPGESASRLHVTIGHAF